MPAPGTTGVPLINQVRLLGQALAAVQSRERGSPTLRTGSAGVTLTSVGAAVWERVQGGASTNGKAEVATHTHQLCTQILHG